MNIIVFIIVFVLCVAFVFPLLNGLFEQRCSSLDAVIEIEGDEITIRQFFIERLFRARGKVIKASSIVRVQLSTDLMNGTRLSLFNSSNGAVDFYVPIHLVNAVKGRLASACPHATFGEV
ncbi:hypothetical protein [Motilimonas eburnea]|uniref:hypothetical protein n=1 Tax=Motilimonas eburnea TaxID=1737488 RepID=UPI001E36A620|nr:hypothetical protein [Motilimonas eburnea]MCE2570962.1 hypothetical protein [Motilimonas eburnea]